MFLQILGFDQVRGSDRKSVLCAENASYCTAASIECYSLYWLHNVFQWVGHMETCCVLNVSLFPYPHSHSHSTIWLRPSFRDFESVRIRDGGVPHCGGCRHSCPLCVSIERILLGHILANVVFALLPVSMLQHILSVCYPK